MKIHLSLKRITAAGVGAVLLTSGAAALADPPVRVARLAYINGPVSFAPSGQNAWEFAALNRVLIPGDRLWAEPGARDEVQVGGAALRMDGGTLATLLNLDDHTTQLQLSQGRLNVRVRQLRPGDVFEIDTPNLALSIRRPGDYRVEVDPSGSATTVAVRSGEAEVYGEGNAYRVAGGQAFSFAGTDLRDVRYAQAAPDEFDSWSAARDGRAERALAARYVSPNLVGYEDLDEQGTWRTVPSYGNVWMPSHVGRDWAPYRDGHWSYVQPWGWTWIDDAPWGFAVSHYGRWARLPEGWGWVPGPRAETPVYAPALVAFISVAAGAFAQHDRPVAWFPLAPHEVYRPSYRASPTYITNINITNTTVDRGQVARDDRRASYANRQVGGAVTAVPATAFVRAQPVSKAALAVPLAALAAAPVTRAAPVAPERDGARGNAGHAPPPAVVARPVLAKNAPPPALRHAPTPSARVPGQVSPAPAAVAALPPVRVLAQDRRAPGRQLRDVPAPAVKTPAPPLAHAPTPVPAPATKTPAPPLANAATPVPAPAPAAAPPLAHAPRPVPAPAPAAAKTPAPPLAHAPTPVAAPAAAVKQPPPPLAHAPAPVPAQAPAVHAGPARLAHAAAPAPERAPAAKAPPSPPAQAPAPVPARELALKSQPAPLAHAPTPAAAPQAPPQHAAPAAPPAPAAAPHPAEPPRLHHAPTPAPQAAQPPRPEPPRVTPPAKQPAQPGHGNEGNKGDQGRQDRPEQK
jgi:hypothetical protein